MPVVLMLSGSQRSQLPVTKTTSRKPDSVSRVKATPLVMIAIGLSFCYLANAWNIGAEGQFLIGAVAGAMKTLATRKAKVKEWGVSFNGTNATLEPILVKYAKAHPSPPPGPTPIRPSLSAPATPLAPV